MTIDEWLISLNVVSSSFICVVARVRISLRLTPGSAVCLAALSRDQTTMCKHHHTCAHDSLWTCIGWLHANFNPSFYLQLPGTHTIRPVELLMSTVPFILNTDILYPNKSALRCALLCEILPRTPSSEFFLFQFPGLISVVIFSIPRIIVSLYAHLSFWSRTKIPI